MLVPNFKSVNICAVCDKCFLSFSQFRRFRDIGLLRGGLHEPGLPGRDVSRAENKGAENKEAEFGVKHADASVLIQTSNSCFVQEICD